MFIYYIYIVLHTVVMCCRFFRHSVMCVCYKEIEKVVSNAPKLDNKKARQHYTKFKKTIQSRCVQYTLCTAHTRVTQKKLYWIFLRDMFSLMASKKRVWCRKLSQIWWYSLALSRKFNSCENSFNFFRTKNHKSLVLAWNLSSSTNQYLLDGVWKSQLEQWIFEIK